MSSSKFQEQVKGKTSQELKSILINAHKFQGALVSEARKELQNRNIELTEKEKLLAEENKKQNIKRIQEEKEITKNTLDPMDESWDRGLVLDQQSPALYTRLILFVFSSLFSPAYSSILFSMNLVKLHKWKFVIVVLLLGILLTGFEMWVVTIDLKDTDSYSSRHYHSRPYRVYLGSLAWHFILNLIFVNVLWQIFIGKNYKHRAKSFYMEGVIGILFAVLLFMYVLQN